MLPLTPIELQILHSLCYRTMLPSHADTERFMNILFHERRNEIISLIKKLEDLDEHA